MKVEKYDGGIYVTFTAKFLDGIGIRIGIAFAIPFIIGLFVLITHIFYKGIACPVHECLGVYQDEENQTVCGFAVFVNRSAYFHDMAEPVGFFAAVAGGCNIWRLICRKENYYDLQICQAAS